MRKLMDKIVEWFEEKKSISVTILKVLFIVFATLGLISFILFLFGYRPLLEEGAVVSWDAVMGITGIIIPFLVVGLSGFVSYRINKATGFIGDSNKASVNETAEKISDVELRLNARIDSLINGITSVPKERELTGEEKHRKLKQEVYKFICLSIGTTTGEVSEKLNISLDKAHEVLKELAMYDRLVGTYLNNDMKKPRENASWFRKS